MSEAKLNVTDPFVTDREFRDNVAKITNIVGLAVQNNERVDYPEMVENLFKHMGSVEATAMHAAVGVAGEAGELVDAIKKAWVYGKPLDFENLVEELGDIYFYMQKLMNMLGVSDVDIAAANMHKLGQRYPDGCYSDAHAQARLDKNGEE